MPELVMIFDPSTGQTIIKSVDNSHIGAGAILSSQIASGQVGTAAFSSGSVSRIRVGTYTGASDPSLTISNLGLRPQKLTITPQPSADGELMYKIWTTQGMIGDLTSGAAIRETSGLVEAVAGRIRSLDVTGFQVLDGGIDDHPNKSGVVYNFLIES